MLKKLIFQVDHKGIDQIEQEILFSLISDKLIAVGCLSVSNISGTMSWSATTIYRGYCRRKLHNNQ